MIDSVDRWSITLSRHDGGITTEQPPTSRNAYGTDRHCPGDTPPEPGGQAQGSVAQRE